MTGHLTDDELIDGLYGLDPAGAARKSHLLSCAACADRLRVFEQRRAEVLDVQPAAPAFLAAQRNQILARVDQRTGFRLQWVPAVLAGVLMVAVAVVPRMYHIQSEAPETAAQQKLAEDQLFREVFSLEAAEEPRAASPIRALFEEAALGEQQ